jgi:urease accessory protein
MRVISERPAVVDPAALAGKERDSVCLTWEERRWTRRRAVTAAGRMIALALPTGSVLQHAEVLAVEPDWYLVVEARPEPVLAAFPRDRAEAIRLAFDIGNRHFSLALDGDAMLAPDDVAIEQLLTRLGVPWERRQAVYDPIGGGGHGHDTGTGLTGRHRHGHAHAGVHRR